MKPIACGMIGTDCIGASCYFAHLGWTGGSFLALIIGGVIGLANSNL